MARPGYLKLPGVPITGTAATICDGMHVYNVNTQAVQLSNQQYCTQFISQKPRMRIQIVLGDGIRHTTPQLYCNTRSFIRPTPRYIENVTSSGSKKTGKVLYYYCHRTKNVLNLNPDSVRLQQFAIVYMVCGFGSE